MAGLARGQESNVYNPILDVFTQVAGVLTDVYSLEFQIFDVSTPLKQTTPVQVYPSIVGTRATVNTTLSAPTTNAGKVSTGRFVATWLPGLAEPLGTHRIRWFFRVSAPSPEQTYIEDFDVLPEASASGSTGYCLVSDLRAEGVPVADFSDDYLSKRIALASALVDAWTGRFFEARALTLRLDGSGRGALLLDQPIIAIDSLSYDSPYYESPYLIDSTSVRVYNRHITQNLSNPDDRNNPKIEYYGGTRERVASLFGAAHFPLGEQNVVLSGVFGYTEYDGSLAGRTPTLISHATKLVVIRELYKLTDYANRDQMRNRSRLTSERTRDQAYTLNPNLVRGGAYTGDPEIDDILGMFARPIAMGAV